VLHATYRKGARATTCYSGCDRTCVTSALPGLHSRTSIKHSNQQLEVLGLQGTKRLRMNR